MHSTFILTGEHIALCDLLKATGIASSGGAGKQMVAAGEIRVNGQIELRKTCKIRAGQKITGAGFSIVVKAAIID